ncbi:Pycsar system effector family protein [Pedobacter insulae]|uniref:Predicted metal-dependent phosphohydrolase, HD superfamily n=1 Tax=Pedobacter insulae TaxID=414048 RepID=A0A1I2WQN0_9SPHI|nr:Pycsar system effector family protein [Pedobacter insulae]SFH03634.1 Predicted metal-dependent phosphohydrolase, HD superfamily [Pedobacter insulae]
MAKINYKQQLEEVKNFVLDYFHTRHDAKLVYHNLDHTQGVVNATMQIANHYQLNDKDFFIVCAGAWFHDTGYFEDIQNHEQKGAEIAIEFLKKQDIPADVRDSVMQVILATKMPQRPTNLLENIICDGDLFHLGTEEFTEKRKLMHKELALLYQIDSNKKEWRLRDVQFLESQHYHTDYCELLLGDQKQKNIDKLKSKLKGEMSAVNVVDEGTVVKEEKLLSKKDKKRPDKGIETMFRITSSNNQRLSDMADNKAQLLITVNSIILSLIVSLVLRRLEDNAFLIVPTFILLMVSLGAIIFSILATRPSIPDGIFSDNDLERKKVNLLFFGNFYKMALSDYSKGMIKVMNDNEFLYGTLITDVYSQGVVLGRKYKLIRIAYNIFMFGLIAAVFAYIISYIAYGKLS